MWKLVIVTGKMFHVSCAIEVEDIDKGHLQEGGSTQTSSVMKGSSSVCEVRLRVPLGAFHCQGFQGLSFDEPINVHEVMLLDMAALPLKPMHAASQGRRCC